MSIPQSMMLLYISASLMPLSFFLSISAKTFLGYGETSHQCKQRLVAESITKRLPLHLDRVLCPAQNALNIIVSMHFGSWLILRLLCSSIIGCSFTFDMTSPVTNTKSDCMTFMESSSRSASPRLLRLCDITSFTFMKGYLAHFDFLLVVRQMERTASYVLAWRKVEQKRIFLLG